MGRKKQETPPWSSAQTALAECMRALGDERCKTVLQGLRRNVRRPRRHRELETLWGNLRALGPRLRDLESAVARCWALEREPTAAPVPDTLRESIEEAVAELMAVRARPSEVREFFERLNAWIQEWRTLTDEAKRMRPQDPVADAVESESMAIARYLVTIDAGGGSPISPRIAALLEVANGEELPRAAVARDRAWEKSLAKWKKALARARMSLRQSPGARRRGV